jgi:hypothetical protein
VLIIILANNFVIGFILIILSNLSAITISIAVCFKYSLTPMDNHDPTGINALTHFYIKPWTRASPYLIGLLIGMLYRQQKLGFI